MTLRALYSALDVLCAFSLQEAWDNSGLIVGDWDQIIHTVVLSIDVDEALLETLEEGTLLITHHPLIFSGLKALDYSRYPAMLLRTMVKKEIANIAMHTNFDQTHLNRWVAENILKRADVRQEGFVATFEVDQPFDAGEAPESFASLETMAD